MSNTLTSADGALVANGDLVSPSGRWVLRMQDDGNLVLYEGAAGDPAAARWQAHCHLGPGPNYYLSMQGDGNLVVYSEQAPAPKAIWFSGVPGGPGPFFLQLEEGNAIVYRGVPGAPLEQVWASAWDGELFDNIWWATQQGTFPPGPDGAGFVVWEGVANNPWEHPNKHEGVVEAKQQPGGGGWWIKIKRGTCSGAATTRAAKHEHAIGNHSYAMSWLCAGQPHNPAVQVLYRQRQALTFRVLEQYYFGRE